MKEDIFENAVILAGRNLKPVDGYLKVQNGIIKEIGEGRPPESGNDVNRAFIIPPFVNAHTHVGDSIQKELYQGKSQPEVVREEGEKFRALETSSDEEKIKEMKKSLSEMEKSGILAHCDFRENGIRGSRLLSRAKDESIRTFILSRPVPNDEVRELVAESDGIGLPSLDFLSTREVERMEKQVSKSDKLLSFHVSETKAAHEKSLEETSETEIQRALNLNPSFLVHGTWATAEDLKSMGDADVPLALCPRSNSLLNSGIPPIKQALEVGTELWLGTDNVSVCPPIMFQELSFAWAILRLQSKDAGSEEARELLKAATVNPADDLDVPFGPLEEGRKAAFVILARERNLRRCKDPYTGIVNRARIDNVETIYHPKIS